MEELIASIAETLNDYREDEDKPSVRITEDNICEWIDQFDDNLRLPILTEMDNIFKKRYCSKKRLNHFLKMIIKTLTKRFEFSSEVEFLENTQFLDLQAHGKSQGVMLTILDELIRDNYGITLNECGRKSHTYSVYIDDVLCSGLTLISNLQEWSNQEFEVGKTNKQAVADGSTKLILNYIFIHDKNYQKKVYEMGKKISQSFATKHLMYRWVDVDNNTNASSKIDLLLPNNVDQPDNVQDYKEQVIETVNEYTAEKGYKTSTDEFFSSDDLPKDETFFTSPENRKTVEDAFLQKGIEILGKANIHNKNIRALGYSMPSVKSFGFGALCFTWRNVPNNTPLVFWYAGGGFTPLFKVSRGNNSAFNFIFDFIPDV
jgi:hypothetical protein